MYLHRIALVFFFCFWNPSKNENRPIVSSDLYKIICEKWGKTGRKTRIAGDARVFGPQTSRRRGQKPYKGVATPRELNNFSPKLLEINNKPLTTKKKYQQSPTPNWNPLKTV